MDPDHHVTETDTVGVMDRSPRDGTDSDMIVCGPVTSMWVDQAGHTSGLN